MTPAFTYEVEAVHDEDDGSISMCNECDADYWGALRAPYYTRRPWLSPGRLDCRLRTP